MPKDLISKVKERARRSKIFRSLPFWAAVSAVIVGSLVAFA